MESTETGEAMGANGKGEFDSRANPIVFEQQGAAEVISFFLFYFFTAAHSPNAGTVEITSISPFLQRFFQAPHCSCADLCRLIPLFHHLGTPHLPFLKLVPEEGGGACQRSIWMG